MAVFWVVAPCSLVGVYQCFRGFAAAIIIALMMEAARTSETLVNFYQTTRRYNPEYSHLHIHRRENLKSYSYYYLTAELHNLVHFFLTCGLFSPPLTGQPHQF
jgi:hypothetical protein